MATEDDFASFHASVFARLVGQVSLVTGDRHEAEDVVSEALARASVRWSRLRRYDLPEAWVRRVALNLAANNARHRRRRLAALLRLGPPAPVPAVDVTDLALAEALRTLPLHQRQALVMHHLLGMPVREVAATLRVPTGTVKARLHRGRRRRRRLAGAATALVVLSLVAGLAGVRELRTPAARELPATAPTAGPSLTMGPTTTAACRGSSCTRAQQGPRPHGYEPVEGTVVAEGTQPGHRWRLVVRRGTLPDGQHELVALFQRDDLSPPVDLVTLEPVKLSFVVPTRGFPSMHGIVSDRTALVRLRIARDGTPVPPLQVRPTEGGTIFPHNAWFVAFLPEGTELYGIELLDRHGGTICAERIKQVKVSDGTETMPNGSCS